MMEQKRAFFLRLVSENLGQRHDHLYIYGQDKKRLLPIYNQSTFPELAELQKRTQKDIDAGPAR